MQVSPTIGALMLGASLLFSSATAAQTGKPVADAAGNAERGQDLFEDRCAFCHQPNGGAGPSLAKIVGRRAGAAAGFHYSAALAGAHLTWTAANLDRFLSAPGKLVPGTAMTVSVPNPAQRADLIAYLATLKP